MNFMITTSPNFDQAWLFLSFIKWFMVVSLLLGTSIDMQAQAPEPPIPIEMLFGHNDMYYQIVVKKAFAPHSKFNFFGLATYTANYENVVADNRMIMITQLSYTFWKGFGVMAGTDINSFSGLRPTHFAYCVWIFYDLWELLLDFLIIFFH